MDVTRWNRFSYDAVEASVRSSFCSSSFRIFFRWPSSSGPFPRNFRISAWSSWTCYSSFSCSWLSSLTKLKSEKF